MLMRFCFPIVLLAVSSELTCTTELPVCTVYVCQQVTTVITNIWVKFVKSLFMIIILVLARVNLLLL